jgi:radical SAM protein with 4Fe4S-binding SPASM domain
LLHPALPEVLAAGYPSGAGALALGLRLRTDLGVLPRLWRWARAAGIAPCLEAAVPPAGGGGADCRPAVAADRIVALLTELAAMDRAEFGRSWPVPPPAAARACQRHLYSCYVSGQGAVYACPGLDLALGDLGAEPLSKIVHDSEVLEQLRDYRANIKAPCRDCGHCASCYGCRGAATRITGDYLAADPWCVLNQGAAIDVLPVAAGHLVPHGPGIRMIDRIVALGERQAYTDFLVPAAGPFLDEAGVLDDTAYIEVIAQTLAAWHGFLSTTPEQRLHRGLLLGVRDLKISGSARTGDRLEVHVRKLARLGGLGVAEGIVRRACDGQELARAEVKVWRFSSDPTPGAL